MNHLIVTDAEVEKALDFLRDSASELGDAAASVTRAERMTKHVKALSMKASGEKSAAAQEREAYASDKYLDAIENEFKAVKRLAELRALREAAAMKIEAWRTASSNYRAMKV